MPTATERLQEALNAYHLLMTGQSAVEIRDYIDELKAEVAGDSLQRTRRPLRPIWG